MSLSIAFVTDDFLPAYTGIGVHTQILAKGLMGHGHGVIILTAWHPGQPRIEGWEGATIYRFPSVEVLGYRQALSGTAAIKKIFQDHRVNLIHYQYMSLLMIQGIRAADALPVKTRQLYTYHLPVDAMTESWPLRPFRRLFRWLHVRYINKLDELVVPTDALMEKVRSHGIRTRATLIPNPIDTSQMAPMVESKSQRTEPQANPFVVLYVGRLAVEKNVPVLIHAFVEFQRSHLQSELWIVGDGPTRPFLEDLCQSSGIGEKVKFYGFIDRTLLGRFYSAAHVLVLPSYFEVQGMVTVEGMRFGLPVLLSNRVEAAGDLVTDGVNGYLFNFDNPTDLARRLYQLASDPALRHELRRGAQEKGKQKAFDVMTALDSIETLYCSR